jgi:hypothetical protein
LRFFWLGTAFLCRETAYREMVHSLRPEPYFEEFWADLVWENESPVLDPTGFAHVIARNGARFRLSTRIIAFPANYFLWEYIPDDDLAWQRLHELRSQGPPELAYSRRLHWSDEFGC